MFGIQVSSTESMYLPLYSGICVTKERIKGCLNVHLNVQCDIFAPHMYM